MQKIKRAVKFIAVFGIICVLGFYVFVVWLFSAIFIEWNKMVVYEQRCEKIYVACEKGDLKSVKIALKLNGNKPCIGEYDSLEGAVRGKNIQVAKVILDAGVDFLGHRPGRLAVIIAVDYGNLEMVKLLVNRGIAISPDGPGNDNALVFASDAGEVEIVKYLLTRIGKDDDYHLNRSLKFARERLHKCKEGDAQSKKLTQIVNLLQDAKDQLSVSPEPKHR